MCSLCYVAEILSPQVKFIGLTVLSEANNLGVHVGLC